MAEVRVRVIPEESGGHPHVLWDVHGHVIPRGIEVLIFYRHSAVKNGRTYWNEPRQLGCICPYDDTDPNCPLPIVGGDYHKG